MSVIESGDRKVAAAALYRQLAPYERSHAGRAWGQIANTLLPYAALWAVMVWMLRQGFPYWQVLLLTIPAGGLLVRTFIFFHDCCHGSFFATTRANRWFGYVTGVLTFTPYEAWQQPHNHHHATASNLDRRGVGDIWTMTVEEYLAAPRRVRLVYRVFRNPFVLFVLGPPVLFLIANRMPRKGSPALRRSILITNLSLLGIAVLAHFTIGLPTYLMIQIPSIWIAGSAGIWLFYVQHQLEDIYWARQPEWDPVKVALEGSSYYKLPPLMQWFTGNIGLHHIHHLRPRIPNYNLQRCYDEVAAMREVEPLTFVRSLNSMRLHLWDEAASRLVGFGAVAGRPRTG